MKQGNVNESILKLFCIFYSLITSALIAKIHVTEWTPTMLNETFVSESVQIEWFGKMSKMVAQYLQANNITLNPAVCAFIHQD